MRIIEGAQINEYVSIESKRKQITCKSYAPYATKSKQEKTMTRSRFNPHTVEVDNLMQMMRLTSLQRLQNKLRIAKEENPSLYVGMVKLIWASIELKKRRAYKPPQ